MKRFLLILLIAAPAAAQINVNISNTVAISNAYAFGVNLGSAEDFQQGQILKSLNFVNSGYVPSAYWETNFYCNNGGTIDSTHWYTNNVDATGFPTNFWVGATYQANSATTGASLGTGTITASSNNFTTGVQFTLSNALSATCSPSAQDTLVVRQIGNNTALTAPPNFFSFTSGGSTCTGWQFVADTSPSSNNTIQSLQIPSGCSVNFFIDGGRPGTNTNTSASGTDASWIDLNGSYTTTWKDKCTAACTIHTTFGRIGGTSYTNATVTPTVNGTPGAGWTTRSFAFTGSETGSQNAKTEMSITCSGTGPCLLQDMDVIEGSTLSGNTSIYRDSVVRRLRTIKGAAKNFSIRFMTGADWASSIPDQITNFPRWNSHSTFAPYPTSPTISWHDEIGLCIAVGAHCWITVGDYNNPTEWAQLITWASTDSNYLALKALGYKIFFEKGNEPWNPGSQGSFYSGGGLVYGTFLGPAMAAAKAATGYDSTFMKLVGAGWIAQGYQSPGQWGNNVVTSAAATTNGKPDYMDNAAYTSDYLLNFDSSGSNVSSSGAPFVDQWAENTNFTMPSLPTSQYSIWNNNKFLLSNFGLQMASYEQNNGAYLFGQTPSTTQLQINQLVDGVGTAVQNVELALLQQRDAGMTGPQYVFTLTQDESKSATGGSLIGMWGTERTMQCGPAELGSCSEVGRPMSVLLSMVNNAIGTNTNLMTTSQSGTPTFSYPGGQAGGCCGYAIASNSAVPLANAFSYSDGSGHWTTILVNRNLTSSQTFNLTGAGAPTGTTSTYTFPNSGNVFTDNNESWYIGSLAVSPVVTAPTSVPGSGASYTVAPGSVLVLTYNLSAASTGTISIGTIKMTGTIKLQ